MTLNEKYLLILDIDARLLFLMGPGSRMYLPVLVGSSHIISVTMKG